MSIIPFKLRGRWNLKRHEWPAQRRRRRAWHLTLAVAFLIGATATLGYLRYPDEPVWLWAKAAAIFSPPATQIPRHSPTPRRLSQVYVVDGDTIHVDGVRVRIENIDAPEVAGGAQCTREAQLADKTTRRLRQLVGSGAVELVPAGGRDEDRYGRKLRRVLVDGTDVGSILVREGLAKPWRGSKASWC